MFANSNDYRRFCSQKCILEAKNNGVNVVGGDKGNCFIATSVYGNYNHPVVVDLRKFRDIHLQNKSWGRRFIKFYYKYGQIAAKKTDKNVFLRKVAFLFIVKPLHLIIQYLNLNK
jgi:hypothetical protein